MKNVRSTGGDGGFASRLNANIIRRVGYRSIYHSAVEEPINVLVFGAVAAEEPVIAENPEVPFSSHRRVRRFRDNVRIGESLMKFDFEKFRQLLFRKSEIFHVEVTVLKLGKFDRKDFKIPLGDFAGLIVGDPIRLDLLGG